MLRLAIAGVTRFVSPSSVAWTCPAIAIHGTCFSVFVVGLSGRTGIAGSIEEEARVDWPGVPRGGEGWEGGGIWPGLLPEVAMGYACLCGGHMAMAWRSHVFVEP